MCTGCVVWEIYFIFISLFFPIQSLNLSILYTAVYLSVYLPIVGVFCISFLYLSVHLLVCLFYCSSVYLFVCISFCLSVYFSFSSDYLVTCSNCLYFCPSFFGITMCMNPCHVLKLFLFLSIFFWVHPVYASMSRA